MSSYIFEKLPIVIAENEKFYDVPKLSECLHCHKSINPFILAISKADMENRTFAILAQCPSCHKYFVMPYRLPFGTNTPEPTEYDCFTPKIELTFPEEIKKVSKNFIDFYEESLIAEKKHLDNLAEIGFKKSIEVLVKDSLYHFSKKSEDNFSQLTLKDSISKIPDSNISSLALTSSWLNDNKGYPNHKFKQKNIEDMKNFIKIFSTFLSYKLSLEEKSEDF